MVIRTLYIYSTYIYIYIYVYQKCNAWKSKNKHGLHKNHVISPAQGVELINNWNRSVLIEFGNIRKRG